MNKPTKGEIRKIIVKHLNNYTVNAQILHNLLSRSSGYMYWDIVAEEIANLWGAKAEEPELLEMCKCILKIFKKEYSNDFAIIEVLTKNIAKAEAK